MDGIAWAGSAMVAARTRLEIATQNLANVSTGAFSRIAARGELTRFGASVRRVATRERGVLRATGRDYDLAIVGDGAFAVRTAAGRTVASRDGSFSRERDGTLRDGQGRALTAGGRVLRLPENARIDSSGTVVTSRGVPLARLTLPQGSSIRSGFLETSSVNAVGEMIAVLSAQRSFESAQKVVTAIDQVRQKASGDVAAVK
ncbi:MAG TPA: flagellar basal body rod C-terminal domain-containing protein [Candidatus Tumulicola sp.]|nr:flagellar basal body rod C-terminal domain-containing protein [Candidatus Tumulicola sp.]